MSSYSYYTNLPRRLTRREEDRLLAIYERVRIAETPPRVWIEDAEPEQIQAIARAIKAMLSPEDDAA